MIEETDADRLGYLIDALEDGSVVKFSAKTGINPPIISRIRNGKTPLAKVIPFILKAYPEVNEEWLKTGEGYEGDLNPDYIRARMTYLLMSKDRTIDMLTRRVEELERQLHKK